MSIWLIAVIVAVGIAVVVLGLRRYAAPQKGAVESREAAARVRPRVSIAGPARVRPRAGRVAPAEREVPAPARPGIGVVAPAEREAPAVAMPIPEVAERVVIPREKEVHKEARMGENYIARDENEKKIIQMIHPDCEVAVESDYDRALATIASCPLKCPYRAVAFQLREITQETLQKRPK